MEKKDGLTVESSNNSIYAQSYKRYLEYYRRLGLVVLPLLPRSKQCFVKNWQQLNPDELLQYFESDSNIGIRLDGLIAIDVEKPELWNVLTDLNIEALSRKTWIQKTGGGGYHILFKGESKPLKVDGFAEIRSGNTQYIVVAPSIHPETGKQYQWLTDTEKVSIAEISKDDLERLRRKLEVLRRFKTFIEAMSECWERYHRHYLALWLSGALYKMGLSIEDARTVLKAIACFSHDEEVNDRLRALEDTYRKDNSVVKGWSGLREELIEITSAEDAERILKLIPVNKEQIDLEYIGNRKWKVIGLSRPSPPITINSGEQLLSSKRFAWLRKKVNEEKLFELAEKINETYEKERDREEDVIIVKPSWSQNLELMDSARKYLEEKLEQFRQMPYPENIYAYREWLRSEVLKNIVAGEENNKSVAYTIIVIGRNYIYGLFGPSTLGKTYFIDSFTELVYDKLIVINRITEHGIDYIDPEKAKGKILYIKEVKVAEGHTFFVLKGFEDHGEQGIFYIVMYPVKLPNGKIKTIPQRLQLSGFITTSNREDVFEPGILERAYTQQLDPSPEQNRKVLVFKDIMRRQEQEIKMGLRKWTDQEWSKALAHLLAKKIETEDCEIMIPFPNLNQIVLEPFVSELDVKRYADKLPKFLEWFGKLYSFFLPEVKSPNGKKFKILTIEVLELGLSEFFETVEAKKQLKKPSEIRFAERVCEYLSKHHKETNAEDPIIIDKLLRKVLSRELGISDNRIRSLFNSLSSLASTAVTAIRVGKEVKFEVNLQELSETLKELGKDEIEKEIFTEDGKLKDEIRVELEKDFYSWTERYRDLLSPTLPEMMHTNQKTSISSFSSQDIRPNSFIFEINKSKQISERKDLGEGFSDLCVADSRDIINNTDQQDSGPAPPSNIKACFLCGENASKLYRVRLYGLGFKMLCRSCASEAIA